MTTEVHDYPALILLIIPEYEPVRMVFTHTPFEFLHAASLDEADRLIEQHPFTLVITDHLTTCQQVCDKWHLPVLAIVAPDQVDTALDAGAVDCLTLPLSERQISTRIRACINQYSFSAYEHAPVMVHSINQQNQIIYINRFWLDQMGYERQEVIGTPIFRYMSEASARASRDYLPNYWELGKGHDLAYRFVRKNGSEFDAVLNSRVTADNRGNPVSLTISRDISMLQAAQQSLRESHENLRAVLDSLPNLVMVLNREGQYLRVATGGNGPMYQAIEPYIGRHVADVLPEKTAGIVMQAIHKTLESNISQVIEYAVPAADGGTRSLQTTLSPLREDEVLAVLLDITDRKHSEEALSESEQRYRSLFTYANDGIMLIDLESGIVTEANPQAARMLGYGRDELPGMAINEIESPIEGQADTRSSIGATIQLITETRYRRKNHTLIDVELSLRLMESGGRTLMLLFFRDITERRRALLAEQEQRHLAEALRDMALTVTSELELNDVLDALLSNIWRVLPAVSSANIMLIEGEQTRIVGARGYETYRLNSEDMLQIVFPIANAPNLRWIIANRKPFIVQNTKDENFRWANEMLSELVLSFVTAPIIFHDQVIGFVNIDSTSPNSFAQEDMRRLSAFASQASIAIQNARLYKRMQQYTEELEQHVEQRTAELQQANTMLLEQIRQREEAEAQLHTERNLLRTVIDTIPDPIYVKDRQSRFIIVNQATVGKLDDEIRKSIRGKSDFDFFPRDFAATLYETEQRVMETGEPILYHSEVFPDSHGRLVHLLVSKLPLRDEQGEVVGVIGINHNITDLRMAEEQLEQVVRSARCLLWSATVTRDQTDQFHWQFNVANETAARGFLPLDAYTRSYSEAWLESILPEDRLKRDYVLETHLTFNKNEFSHEFRVQLPDQSVRWLVEDVRVQEIADHQWYLAGVCTEITTRKQVEERLQQINDELEEGVQKRTQELLHINTTLRQEIQDRRRAEESERNQRRLAEALRDSAAKVNSTLDLEEVFTTLLEAIRPVVPYDAADIMLLEDTTHGRIRHHQGYDFEVSQELRDISKWSDKMQAYHTGKPFIISDVNLFPDFENKEHIGWIRSNISVPIQLEQEIIGFLTLNSAIPDSFTPEQADWLQTFAIQVGTAIRNARMVEEIRHYTQELEARVQERTRELEVERAQLKAILDAMREGVYYGQLNQPPQYINQALTTITGYSLDEWITGMAQQGLNIEMEEIRAFTWQEVDRMLQKQGYWRGETTLRRRDGSAFSAELGRTEVRSADGQRAGVVTVLRDISQEKALQEQKARFIAIAAHELRTPIANMKTRLFLMRRQPERFEEHAEIAAAVINWMQHLVEDMFDLARFERGIIKLTREDLHLQEMVSQILAFQQPEAERQDIHMQMEMPPEPIIIYADPYRMMQVISNLVRNSLQYTERNGFIRVVAKITQDMLFIHVIDSGRGIAPEYLPHLFQPFFRVSEDNKGAGLGLSIAQEIIHAHGGTIRVESELDKGSTFIIALPLAELRSAQPVQLSGAPDAL